MIHSKTPSRPLTEPGNSILVLSIPSTPYFARVLRSAPPIRSHSVPPLQRAGMVMSGAGAAGPAWMRHNCISSASVSFDRMSSFAML